jgi:hypothetical protein
LIWQFSLTCIGMGYGRPMLTFYAW